MAVYKKTYRPYDGGLTSQWTRFLTIPRYAFEDLHRSRFLTTFFIASFIYPLICALIIYVQHNVSALNLVGVPGANRLIAINVTFFMSLLGWQSMLALFLAAFIGPGQVSPDLANNALSLYLARPFSRLEYVLGKLSVLVILMSLMTWVPGLLLFGLQGYLEGWSWIGDNARLACGLFFGAWIWIVVLALLALAGSRRQNLEKSLGCAQRHLASCRSAEGRGWLEMALLAHGRTQAVSSPVAPTFRSLIDTAVFVVARAAAQGRNVFLS